MEHSDLDKLFKKSVDEIESKTELEEGVKNRLWAQIEQGSGSNALLFWKVASLVLFLLSSALAFSLIYEDTFIDSNPQLSETGLSSEYFVKPTKDTIVKVVYHTDTVFREVLVTKNVIEYVDREKIVYVENDIPESNSQELDQLKKLIQEQEQEIAQLNSTLKKESSEVSENTNLQVAFLNDESADLPAKNSDTKLKFQLSLFNLTK